MAYYELARLSNELDKLLRTLREFLTINNRLTNLFIRKVGEVLRILEVERTTTLPEQLENEILSLALPIGDIFWKLSMVRKSWYPDIVMREIGTGIQFQMLLRRVRNSVEEINSITETRLEKFLDDTDLYDNWKELRNNLQVVTCREAVRSLVQASRELKEALNFFHDVVKETDLLAQYLKFLTTLFENSKFQKECNGLEMVKCIRDIASKAFDAVYSPNKDCWPGVDAFSLEPPHGVRKGQNASQWAVKKYLEGKNGKRFVLLETLGKLHSFEGEINMICKKIGIEEFQSCNASRSSSPSWNMCYLCVDPRIEKEKKLFQKKMKASHLK